MVFSPTRPFTHEPFPEGEVGGVKVLVAKMGRHIKYVVGREVCDGFTRAHNQFHFRSRASD